MSNVFSAVAEARSESASSAWAEFTSAPSDQALCAAWLRLQCEMVPGTRAALLLLRSDSDGAYVPAAVWPDASHDVSYLGEAAQQALQKGRGLVVGLAEQSNVAPGRLHVACPLELDSELPGVVVLDLASRSEVEVQRVLRQLLWGLGWMQALLRRRRATRDQQVLDRAAVALQALQAAHQHETVDEAALAVVNDLATSLRVDRVSIGLLVRGDVRLRAISRSAWFERKSDLGQSLENAMEEATDQEACVIHPQVPSAGGARVCVAQRDLAIRAGAASVLSAPLFSHGSVVGAITLERHEGTFDADDALLGGLLGELLGPAFESRLKLDRWFAGQAQVALRTAYDRLVGPRWPAAKAAAGLGVLTLLFLLLAQGEFRVTARTIIEGQMQRAAVAPFDGFVASANARAGDTVKQGAVLATLDDREVRLELMRWRAEREQAAQKYREALANGDAAASRVFSAQQAQAEAQVALAEFKLARTRIIAPIDSVVVSGDLSQMLGAPVERGKVLFELAPAGAYRVILQVDDRDVGHLSTGQPGELVLAGIAGDTFPFRVKAVTSVSTPEEGRNYFRVEAELADPEGRLRPGMEGVGKITIGERQLVWIWTRKFTEWLRIALWTWVP
jgi:RND family efflux transporter MFP subunit